MTKEKKEINKPKKKAKLPKKVISNVRKIHKISKTFEKQIARTSKTIEKLNSKINESFNPNNFTKEYKKFICDDEIEFALFYLEEHVHVLKFFDSYSKHLIRNMKHTRWTDPNENRNSWVDYDALLYDNAIQNIFSQESFPLPPVAEEVPPTPPQQHRSV
tara:strand:+ start:177 stop:656 length:480 start_codon:yes stop_codon:yes gene_type:complete